MARRAVRYKHNRLQQLRGFVYAAQEGNMSRAAARMFLSRPSVSLQVQSLERETNSMLVDRNSPKISPKACS